MGPLTETTYSVVMTLQAAYERIRHLEAVVRAREGLAEHWEAECRAAVVWQNETTPSNFKATKLKITQTGKAEEYTGLPTVLHVYGEVRDERWFHESPHKREAKYILVQDLTHDSPLQTWPCQLVTAANDILGLMGAELIPIGEDGGIKAGVFHGRAREVLLLMEEDHTKCREAVGLTDTDDISLLEHLRKMREPKVAEPIEEGAVQEALLLEMDRGLKQIFALVGLPGAPCPNTGLGFAITDRIVPRVAEMKAAYEQALEERNEFARRLSRWEVIEGNHLPMDLLAPHPQVGEHPVEEVPEEVREQASEPPEAGPSPRRKSAHYSPAPPRNLKGED